MDQSSDSAAQWFNQSMQQFADNILNAARIAALKNIQATCYKGIREPHVTAETMTELITVMVSALAVTAPASASEESLKTMDALSRFFAHANESWGNSQQTGTMPTPNKVEIPENIRRQLNDLFE